MEKSGQYSNSLESQASEIAKVTTAKAYFFAQEE